MADTGRPTKSSTARDTFDTLWEMSKMLNVGLDAETLALCVRLCECGVNPDGLSQVIQELRKEAASMEVSDSAGSSS